MTFRRYLATLRSLPLGGPRVQLTVLVWMLVVTLAPVPRGGGLGALALSLLDLPIRLAVVAATMSAARRVADTPLARSMRLAAVAVASVQAAAVAFRLKWAYPYRLDGWPIPDLLHLAAYLSLVLATVSLPVRAVPWRTRATTLLDATAVAGGFGLVVWYYLLRDSHQMSGFGSVLGPIIEVAYPILDVVMLVAIIGHAPVEQARGRPLQRALLVTVCAFFLADTLFGIAFYVAGHVAPAVAAELGYALGTMSFLRVASAARRTRDAVEVAGPDDSREPALARFSPIGSLAVGAAVLAAVLEASGSIDRVPFAMLIAAGSLVLLVLLRQTTASRAGVAWMAAQQRLLEEQVRLRTQELADANDRLAALALQDGLTGLRNRRAFDAALERGWSDAVRAGAPLSLLLIDVDAFKRFNDVAGHQAGDACLRAVASCLAAAAPRATDTVARYGGEEFAVLALQTGPDGAGQLADCVVRAVRTARLEHPASPVASHVTVSVGAASMVPGRDLSPSDLVQAADAALYRAKQAGRDRAELARVPAELNAPLRSP